MTVADRNKLHHGVIPARFASLYTRDEPTTANLQIQAEIGPTGKLSTPLNIMSELTLWSDIYEKMIAQYLPDATEYHCLPLNPKSRHVTHLPSQLSYDDPRPIVQDGKYFDQIDRRRVNARVDFDRLSEQVDDQAVVTSALHAISAYMTRQIKQWYQTLDLPMRKEFEVSELVEAKEREKQRLFGDTT